MKEYLLIIGYTEEKIKELLELGKLKQIDKEIIIVDADLFADFIIKILAESIDPLVYFQTDDNSDSILYHVFKYIDLKMYGEACCLLDIYNKENPDCFYSNLLKDGLSRIPDKTEYLMEEDKHNSDYIKSHFKKKELELLAAYELGHRKEANEIYEDIKFAYKCNQDLLPFIVIDKLIDEINKLNTNHRRISKRDSRAITGDPDSIIIELLLKQDYYRIERFLKEEIASHANPSIKYSIYNILVSEIMYINQQNLKYVQDTIVVDSETNKLENILKLQHIPFLSGEYINKLLHPAKKEERSINYFPVYESLKKEGNYVEAKKALKAFDLDMKRMNVFSDFDYRFNELDILIEMKKTLSEEEMKSYVDSISEAKKLMADSNYTEAIDKLSELNKKYPNPFVTNMIGSCYYSLEDHTKAVEYYSKAKTGYIYPEDLYNSIYSYYKLGEYEKALNAINRYNYYYPEEIVKLYYIQSICQVKLNEYKEAVDTLELCEAMNVLYYNMPIEYKREKEVIRKISNGRNIECYSEDDFISYDLTLEEEELKNDIKKGKTNVANILRVGTLNKKGLIDKIEYLFSCAKVYFQMEKEDEGLELCKFIETLLKNDRLDKDAKETFTLRLKNYKSI